MLEDSLRYYGRIVGCGRMMCRLEPGSPVRSFCRGLSKRGRQPVLNYWPRKQREADPSKGNVECGLSGLHDWLDRGDERRQEPNV